MTEEEEFEFRFRLEQEQGQDRKEDKKLPSTKGRIFD